jgi:hypothetical protein
MLIYIPRATDLFDRADEAPLAGNWTDGGQQNVFNLTGNKIQPANLPQDCLAFWNALTFDRDHSSECLVTVTGTAGGGAGIGPAVRCSGGSNCYRLILDHAASSNVALQRFVAGAFTSLLTVSRTFTDGDLWKIAVVLDTIYAFHKDVLVFKFRDITPLLTGGPGVSYSSTETSASLDGWIGSNVVTIDDKFDASLYPKIAPFGRGSR